VLLANTHWPRFGGCVGWGWGCGCGCGCCCSSPTSSFAGCSGPTTM